MADLSFSPVGPEDRDRIFAYTSVFGGGSCQYSPASMFGLEEKYGDAVCERDGLLYFPWGTRKSSRTASGASWRTPGPGDGGRRSRR